MKAGVSAAGDQAQAGGTPGAPGAVQGVQTVQGAPGEALGVSEVQESAGAVGTEGMGTQESTEGVKRKARTRKRRAKDTATE